MMSFAAITEESPPEVASAGHDRCVIPIVEANIDTWLTLEGRSKEEPSVRYPTSMGRGEHEP